MVLHGPLANWTSFSTWNVLVTALIGFGVFYWGPRPPGLHQPFPRESWNFFAAELLCCIAL